MTARGPVRVIEHQRPEPPSYDAQIDALMAQIDDLQLQIDAQETLIEALEQRITDLETGGI